MASNESDRLATKLARSVLAKRGIDVSRCDMRVTHGVCYIRGLVRPMPGVVIPDLKAEMENVAKALRAKQDIRDVVLEINTRH